MAMLEKEMFDNPYVDIGKHNDICVLCRKEYLREHKDESEYKAEDVLRGKLLGHKVFKLFRNSNTPLVLCAHHIKETADAIQEDEG